MGGRRVGEGAIRRLLQDVTRRAAHAAPGDGIVAITITVDNWVEHRRGRRCRDRYRLSVAPPTISRAVEGLDTIVICTLRFATNRCRRTTSRIHYNGAHEIIMCGFLQRVTKCSCDCDPTYGVVSLVVRIGNRVKYRRTWHSGS